VTRPTDWEAVLGISDPTPGDPWSIRGMQRSWSDLADDAEHAESKVRQLLGDDAISGWIGEGGNAFRDKTYDLPDQLGKCHRSYRLAADALSTWANRLETHQSAADRALAQGRDAQADLNAANASLTSASGSDVLAFLERYADTPPPASVTPPSEEAIRNARARLSSAQFAQSGAQGRLDAARQLALDAGSLREEDGRTAAHKIREASDAGIPERSRWDKFKDWAADAWHIIVEICKIVVLVLGIVALIIGGPLAWVVFAAALLVLADTIMKYLNGEASLWDVALAALACIPCTKGLTTLSELSAAFRSGGMLGAGAHLLGATRTMARSLLTSANLLRKGFLPGSKAALAVLGDAAATGFPSIRTTLGEMRVAFSETMNATASPADLARMWQGKPPYGGIDGYSSVTLSPGTSLEAGFPGLSSYSMPGGTAAAHGYSASGVWEGVQVGPNAAGTPFAGYRGSMVELQVTGDVSGATGVTLANPQFGAGGTPQFFFDIKSEISAGNVAVLDHAGTPIHIPAGTPVGDVEGLIKAGLGGPQGTIVLTGAGSPAASVMTLQDAGNLYQVPDGIRHLITTPGILTSGTTR